MSFQFQYKEFAWLFAGVAVLVLLFLSLWLWKKKITRRIGDEKLVKALISNYSSQLFTTKFIILSVAFMLGVIAVMNPRNPGESNAVNRKGIDIAIALDVSKSMLAADPSPNRLERAKQFISKLMNEMPNDRVALILFAGKAYLQMPLTTDHGAAGLFVSSASPEAVPQQGTVISDALNMSVNAFTDAGNKFKTVVLISDGEDHDEDAVATAKKLAGQGVMINTIGIGSPEGTTIVDPATGEIKKDETGNPVISRLNEEELKQIAEKTNGIYIHLLGSDAAVSALTKQFSQIDRKSFVDMSQINFNTYYIWFAALMFILLGVENFIPERKRISAL
ncbi:MAG: VWA domain-containing protein [Chitinophagaceae bacterium]|nr:VWA domain-containing protein [Chitinophagaceae bacterium]